MADGTTDLDLAREMAADAGRLLVAYRSGVGPVEPDDKDALRRLRDGADRRSHEFIAAALSASRPDDALLSEEGKDDAARLDHERVWIVDPLDGTWEYGQGRADFGVHVALWLAPRGDRPEQLAATVVDLPAADVVRTTGDPAPVLPPLAQDRPWRVVASRTRPPAELDAIVARWQRITGHPVEVVNVGSVGAKVEEILAGRAEAYLHNTGFYEWDLAAPMGVAQHYGLVIEHWDGSSISLNQMPPYVRDVLVVRPELAQSLREAIRS
jgi:3'(2'), 5'-bisphosphate nucleotidase